MIGFHRVNQGINGTGRKNAEGKLLQKLRDQNRRVRVHGWAHQAHFCTDTGTIQDGNVRDLAAGAAGGRENHERPSLGKIGCHIIESVYALVPRHGQHLGDVTDRAAADGYDPFAAGFHHVFQNCLRHRVCGLAHAVPLLVQHTAG